MLRSIVLLPLLMLIALLNSGCTTTDATTVDTRDFRQTPTKTVVGDAVKLVAGDAVEISVEVDGRMEVPLQQATINRLGFITLPLVGDVHIGGVGLDVARAEVARKYGAYYVSKPVILLSVVDKGDANEWGQVSVMGRVNNPGPVALSSSSGMKLSAAIQAAGGFASSAKTSEIQVTRVGSGGNKMRVSVDFNAIGAAGNADADIKLLDGDIVYVPERIF